MHDLSTEEKDALLACFAAGFCIGAPDIWEHYAVYEDVVLSHLRGPREALQKKQEEIYTLQGALAKFLKYTSPGMDNLKTAEDFRTKLKEIRDIEGK